MAKTLKINQIKVVDVNFNQRASGEDQVEEWKSRMKRDFWLKE